MFIINTHELRIYVKVIYKLRCCFLLLYLILFRFKNIIMSIFSDILYYGNWAISLACWLFWDYQIIRSCHLYWKHEKGGGFDILTLHVLLFIANFLFVLYEVNVTLTPVYLTMLLITDITGIWCFLLVT